MKPFLKWAGGKRWLVNAHPDLFSVPFRRYIEPFVGSGAVFFSLRPSKGIISDANEELIGSYRAIRDSWEAVLERLKGFQRTHSKETYYQIRNWSPDCSVGKAARFIYLNRTCWNGLYRVNKRGEFNVPVGTKTNVLLDDDFQSVSRLLKGIDIRYGDFSAPLSEATEGDLVFADPPYTVHHNVNGFLKYNQTLFTWNDQVRLRDEVVRARNRGAKVLVSNAAHVSVQNLYAGVGEIITLSRPSVISGKSSGRRMQDEILIQCL